MAGDILRSIRASRVATRLADGSGMELRNLTERIWIYTYEKERDRPNLGYIRGDRWSFAVDAGHSDDHVASFYQALDRAGLPLPSLTVLTHWHWDHTFGMHAVSGLCLANSRTNHYLREARNRLSREGVESFLALDESIRREYAGGRPVVVSLADLTFEGEMSLELGGCQVRVFQADAPHTDDSTLVHVPGEGVLFIGDAMSGPFPTWERDPVLSQRLADIIEAIDAELCIGSHWEPMTRQELLADLRRG